MSTLLSSALYYVVLLQFPRPLRGLGADELLGSANAITGAATVIGAVAASSGGVGTVLVATFGPGLTGALGGVGPLMAVLGALGVLAAFVAAPLVTAGERNDVRPVS